MKKEKQVMGKGVCSYYEYVGYGEVSVSYLVPKINFNSISLYLVIISGSYEEGGSPDNLEDVEKDEHLIAEIYRDHIDFMLDLVTEGSGCYDITSFSSFAQDMYSISNFNCTEYGDGDLRDMYRAINDVHKKSNKVYSKSKSLNQRFITLFRNTGNTLIDVVKTLRSEGFNDKEIYKAMLITMKDITWEE